MVWVPRRHAGVHARRRAAQARASTSGCDAGLTIVGDSFHQFAPQGVTGTVLLAESHLAIHTWPEHGFVTVDVYVCNLATDNTAKAERAVPRARGGAEAAAHEVPGDSPRRPGCLTSRPARRAAPAGDVAPGLMTEYLTDEWGFFIRSARQFEKFRSPYQAVEVHDTVPFGKLFRLDGHFMTSEKDEFFYHENLVHMAALTHPQPERALDRRRRRRRLGRGAAQAPVDPLGDAVRDRPRRRRHRAQVPADGARRRARRSAAHAQDRRRLRLRARGGRTSTT